MTRHIKIDCKIARNEKIDLFQSNLKYSSD